MAWRSSTSATPMHLERMVVRQKLRHRSISSESKIWWANRMAQRMTPKKLGAIFEASGLRSAKCWAYRSRRAFRELGCTTRKPGKMRRKNKSTNLPTMGNDGSGHEGRENSTLRAFSSRIASARFRSGSRSEPVRSAESSACWLRESEDVVKDSTLSTPTESKVLEMVEVWFKMSLTLDFKSLSWSAITRSSRSADSWLPSILASSSRSLSSMVFPYPTGSPGFWSARYLHVRPFRAQ
ncbi:hypothetical protein CLUG_02931 [Clavispora lusitaniae ATCC 42720]|uniref:Uncharacterized protein n=1 Tax=Clavispora lusitaniae (strain ATCC 42720) TaxID=306902 RepID=C4Y318_CLAL4|nr:uncharacterized protein CLUG_02931 [Clavispora lusitaniae ATCC 42720]EEQ38805.1 hypothetical protein CLUG_02931 [Clavispora lusitaniae ATCC 42720]